MTQDAADTIVPDQTQPDGLASESSPPLAVRKDEATGAEMTPASPADDGIALVDQLPRPNLGPEPWSDGRGGREGLAIAVGLALIAFSVVTLRLIRGRSKRRHPADAASVGEAADEARGIPATAGDRLILAADDVRRALVRRFGPPWAAKTTEEIAVEPAFHEWLGPERARTVLDLLAAADRAKFAAIDAETRAEDEGDQGAEWETVAVEVELAARDGAMSRTKGR